jgi:hypothetical protein
MVEKFILTRSMHLGHLKDTFGRGAVIMYDEDKRTLNIDGRKFDDIRDIEILKRQAAKRPDAPWIIPFTTDDLADMRGGKEEAAPVVAKRDKPGVGMQVVRSDEDETASIDIRNTQVGKRNAERKDASRQRVRDEGMEIIQGDESVEDRIARLKGAKNTDMGARAERVRLMRDRAAKIPIIQDDSLGAGVGSKGSSLNAGIPVGGRRAEDTPAEVRARAEERRRVAEAARASIEAGDEDMAEALASGADVVPDSRDTEIAELKARLASMEKAAAPVVNVDTPKNPVLPKKAKRVVAKKAEKAEKPVDKKPRAYRKSKVVANEGVEAAQPAKVEE